MIHVLLPGAIPFIERCCRSYCQTSYFQMKIYLRIWEEREGAPRNLDLCHARKRHFRFETCTDFYFTNFTCKRVNKPVTAARRQPLIMPRSFKKNVCSCFRLNAIFCCSCACAMCIVHYTSHHISGLIIHDTYMQYKRNVSVT